MSIEGVLRLAAEHVRRRRDTFASDEATQALLALKVNDHHCTEMAWCGQNLTHSMQPVHCEASMAITTQSWAATPGSLRRRG